MNLEEIKAHHDLVKQHYIDYIVLFTSCVGSQNYGLETANSDIDTCSFILPSFLDFICGKPFISAEFDTDNGKCVIKDLRLAFNLLRKPSPNSIEWFLSPYKYYNPTYETVLKHFLENEMAMYTLIHANTNNMLDAIKGTTQGLHGRNMSMGKKISHLIRLTHLAKSYMLSDKTFSYLLLPEQDKTLALELKTSNDNEVMESLNQFFTQKLIDYIDMCKKTSVDEKLQALSNNLINLFESKLFEVYFKENGYEKTN